jgi:uncharacterized protein (TIGR02001 family)
MKILPYLSIILCWLPIPVVGDVSGSLTLSSDYLDKGVSQTDSKPALQMGLEYQGSEGFYGGGWLSNVDFDSEVDAELDVFAGYRWEPNPSLGLDVCVVEYLYLNHSADKGSNYVDSHYNEFYIIATAFDRTQFGYAYTRNVSDTGNQHSILTVSQQFPLSKYLQFEVTANHLINHEDRRFYQQGSEKHYQHVQVLLLWQAYNLHWSLSAETNNDTSEFGSHIDPVLSVSYRY